MTSSQPTRFQSPISSLIKLSPSCPVKVKLSSQYICSLIFQLKKDTFHKQMDSTTNRIEAPIPSSRNFVQPTSPYFDLLPALL
jgi:hypothetical protein